MAAERHVHRYDTPEYARLVNLSDAVFAIAMTLLVLNLDLPDVVADGLPAALRDLAPQVVVFLLSFGLVAAVWWQHHVFFARFDRVDPLMTVLNLAMLAAVALVPFPTGLVGAQPTAPAAVAALVAVFLALNTLALLLILRAQAIGAWRQPPPQEVVRWIIIGWVGALAGVVAALVVALRWPIAGLVLLAVSGLVSEAVVRWRAPASYRAYS